MSSKAPYTSTAVLILTLQIQTLLAEHPAWHRTRISRTLCDLWGWRNETGQLKDMACRTLLLKPLHRNSRSRLTMS